MVYNRTNGTKLYRFFNSLSESRYFSSLISLSIVGNTIVLALDRYPITDAELAVHELANQVFTGIFFIEMVVKMIGFGFQAYFSDLFNMFDCFIVIVSLVDFIFTIAGFGSSGGGAIGAMRAFRLLRIFKLAKSWKKFQSLLVTIAHTMASMAPFTVIMLIFIFIYTLLGMELFAKKVNFNSDGDFDLENGMSPSSNFDNFLEGFASVFIVLANDGWSTIFFDHYRADMAGTSLVFFISLLLIGQFILWNLFLAILLQNFDDDSKENAEEENLKNKKDKKKGSNSLFSRID
jgi:hypothetical protein